MQKITNRTLHTPINAAYVQVTERDNGVVSLEYFSENKSHIPFAPFSARVMSEDSYAKMVKAPVDLGGKTNPEPKDPRQTKKVRDQADKHPARNITTSDEVMGYKPNGDYPMIDLRQNDAIKNAVTVAKQPRGTVKGESDFREAFTLDEDIAIDTKYTWGAVEEALFAAGLDVEQVKAVKLQLFGDEAIARPRIGESQLFNEAPENFVETEDEYPVEDDIDAVDDAFGTSEPRNEVYIGQSQSDLFDTIVNLSDEEIETLNQIDRGRRIKQVRISNGEVVKVIPGTIRGTFLEGDILYAKVRVGTKNAKIKLAQNDKVLVKKGERTDILYSIKTIA